MRFKHTKTILLIITNLLLLSLLYISYQKIQKVREQKSLSGSVCQGHPTREKPEKKEKMFKFRKGFRNFYVTAYYPTKDGQPVEIVKEKIQEDLQRLGSDENQRTKAFDLLP